MAFPFKLCFQFPISYWFIVYLLQYVIRYDAKLIEPLAAKVHANIEDYPRLGKNIFFSLILNGDLIC